MYCTHSMHVPPADAVVMQCSQSSVVLSPSSPSIAIPFPSSPSPPHSLQRGCEYCKQIQLNWWAAKKIEPLTPEQQVRL